MFQHLSDIPILSLIHILEVPPDTKLGDYAFPCFKLSKALRKSPVMIADQLAAAIRADFLARVESVRGYLNFFIDRAIYAERVLTAAEAQGDQYGADNSGAGKCVVLDYSSINIAKRFHIGHLSTTMIGNALYKLYKFFGWKAVGVNHLGDWGTQFGKMIAAYKKWGDREMCIRDSQRTGRGMRAAALRCEFAVAPLRRLCRRVKDVYKRQPLFRA